VSKTVLYMSVSLDGFAAGPNESKDHGLGDGGLRLHEWMNHPHGPTGTNKAVWDAFMSTGAVVGGRRLYEMTGGWGNDHHDFGSGQPLFDGLGPHHTELERLRTVEGEDGIIHLRYRVKGARSASATQGSGQ
jgi:hypothetical protein